MLWCQSWGGWGFRTAVAGSTQEPSCLMAPVAAQTLLWALGYAPRPKRILKGPIPIWMKSSLG